MKIKITLLQYIFIIHGVQMGVGALVLPRDLAAEAGTDGWITLLISWLISTAACLMIIQIMKKHPNGTILELIAHYFGKWVGKFSTIVFALYFALLAHVVLIREALFVQEWILPRTEVYLLILLLSIPSYLIVRNEINILGRYSVLVFFMSLWAIFIYIMPWEHAHWLHLLPFVKEGWLPIIAATKATIFPFLGFEVAFFLYPFLHNKEKASMGIVIANTISLLLFLFITIGAFAFFSPDEITLYKEPPLEMLKVVGFEFIERLEIVFFSFYLFVMSTTVLPYMFLAVYCTRQFTGKPDHRQYLVWFLILEIIYALLFSPSFDNSMKLKQITEQAGFIIAFAFPFCLWGYVSLYSRFKRRVIK